MKITKIHLIDSPKKEFAIDANAMSSLIGGYNCPGTYQDGGIGGTDYCSASYSSGECGSASDYCTSYFSCTWKLD